MERYLERFTPAKTFEELTTPLAIAATDINAGVTVFYTRGPLGPPLRGSCAYPGLFVPIQFENRTLVDGFLTAPVPVEGTLLLGADVVIAVYLEAGSLENPRTAADVISRSFTIIQRHADLAWRQQADVIIEPDVKSFVWDDFTRTNDLVAVGQAATEAVMPQILEALGAKPEPAA
jgi:NTE family protein